MVSLDIGPAPVNADIEEVEVAGQVLIHSLLQLGHILSSSQLIECWQANVLRLNQSVLHYLLVMLSDLNSAQVGCSSVVARNVSVVVKQFLELVVEGIGWSVGVHLH